jgi:excisionase family DNA binding protein
MTGKQQRATDWDKPPRPRVQLLKFPPEEGPFWTVPEVAAYLRVSRATIYRLLKRNQLVGAFRVGTDYRFHREIVKRWTETETERYVEK